jgi:hypothetical protein
MTPCKLSKALKGILEELPADITVAQARLALIDNYIPANLWEELSALELEYGEAMPLNWKAYRSIDGEPDMPPLPSPPPKSKPSYAWVNCGGFNVSERTWQKVNASPGYRPEQSLLDNEAYEAVANGEESNQYYCHDCDEVFDEIKRLEDGNDPA